MEQRDIIKDQIEQLGKAIGKLMANFLDIKTKGNVNDAIQVTNQNLQTEIDLDIDKLILFESDELEEYVESLNLNDMHLDHLSNYFFEIGIFKKSDDNQEESLKYFKTAIQLLKLAEKNSTTITFDRIDLKRKIENELQ